MASFSVCRRVGNHLVQSTSTLTSRTNQRHGLLLIRQFSASEAARSGDKPHQPPQKGWRHKPKVWEGPAGSLSNPSPYTLEDVAEWRADFGFARRQHSLAQFGYTDDELLEWRKPFDELAEDNRIQYPVFEQFMIEKFSGLIDDRHIAEKVRISWRRFDRDGNNEVDFGEFIGAGLLFDIDLAKEKIRQIGIEETFAEYSEDDFMLEPHFFKLMCDFRFFVATATDVQKLVQAADKDGDGLVSLSDFMQWAESIDIADDSGEPAGEKKRRKRGSGRRLVAPPPPEPE
eukprot:TRINITY_DN26124_c0_g1_i1.p1 TRINITY_DN26124_c0_g1~~TRINITY_DN26124_c0_g1_i1.p1  ORF type:complete len:287 (-),score=53.76 TRINITY_DN26124_c0_g1_i1:94-954(-)